MIKTAVYGSKAHRKKIAESLALTRKTGETAAQRRAKSRKGSLRAKKRSLGVEVTAPAIDIPFVKA